MREIKFKCWDEKLKRMLDHAFEDGFEVTLSKVLSLSILN